MWTIVVIGLIGIIFAGKTVFFVSTSSSSSLDKGSNIDFFELDSRDRQIRF